MKSGVDGCGELTHNLQKSSVPEYKDELVKEGGYVPAWG
jgi:hypothetical protein